jgi:predicted aspartyl protease
MPVTGWFQSMQSERDIDCRRAPFIEVGVGHYEAAEPTIRGLPCLIDTGAEGCHIDRSLANRCRFPVHSERETISDAGVQLVPVYAISLFVGTDRLSLYASASDFAGRNNTQMVMLGMEALQVFHLTVCRADGVVSLAWRG